ncbi:unnamed protein product, partial [Iphiclides podalirius]
MQNNPQELSWQAIQTIVGVKLPPNVLRFDDIGFHLVNNSASSAEDSDSDVEIVENDWESDNNVSSKPENSDNEKASPDREQSESPVLHLIEPDNNNSDKNSLDYRDYLVKMDTKDTDSDQLAQTQIDDADSSNGNVMSIENYLEVTLSTDSEASHTCSQCNQIFSSSTSNLKRNTSGDRTDLDVIRENHKFLWEDDDVADTWEKQLAKKYYDKLFKEYCICDLSRYKENKVALRWRVEKEVVLGKGQFQCGAKQCNSDQGLKSWEVNFAYIEDKEKKNALVKLRLCLECSEKLNYKSKKREVKRLKKNLKKKKRIESSRGDDVNSGDECPPVEEIQPEPSTSRETADSEWNKDESLWKKAVQEVEEKSREDEFEEYLQDLLL